MPSIASRIIELHAQKHSRDEIMRITGCKHHYLRSVLSRASAPDDETRKLREKGTPPPKGSPRYNASLAGWAARKAALDKGKTIEQARRAQRKAKRDYLARAAQPANSIVSGRQPNQPKEARP